MSTRVRSVFQSWRARDLGLGIALGGEGGADGVERQVEQGAVEGAALFQGQVGLQGFQIEALETLELEVHHPLAQSLFDGNHELEIAAGTLGRLRPPAALP